MGTTSLFAYMFFVSPNADSPLKVVFALLDPNNFKRRWQYFSWLLSLGAASVGYVWGMLLWFAADKDTPDWWARWQKAMMLLSFTCCMFVAFTNLVIWNRFVRMYNPSCSQLLTDWFDQIGVGWTW